MLDKGLENGYWVRPTVFTDCTDDMRIVQEEIFGPVMSILYYDTTEEAVEHANKADLGLPLACSERISTWLTKSSHNSRPALRGSIHGEKAQQR